MNNPDLLHRAITAEEKLADTNRKLEAAKEALNQIANQDYRGNRSTESQIAYKALTLINSTKGVMRE